MIIKRIGVLSCGKIVGTLYGLIGLLIGGIATLFSLVAGAAGAMSGVDDALFSSFFGAFAIILFPVFYGIMGFVGGLLTAFIYNLATGLVGGIEIEVEQKSMM